MSDLRADRLIEIRKRSLKACYGPAYHDSWHQFASYRKQREDKYKNKNRTTIRKIKWEKFDA